MDGDSSGVDCKSTDSVFCDHCKVYNRSRIGVGAKVKGGYQGEQEREHESEQEPSGQQMIGRRLRALQEAHDCMIKVMNRLQGQCIYCTLTHKEGWMGKSISHGHKSIGELHEYKECLDAEADGCGFKAYQQWRKRVSFGQAKHCWECGLSQRICRRLERGKGKKGEYEACEYADIMLPSIFVLHQQQHLIGIVKAVGFQGDYSSEDLGEWLNDTAEGFGWEWQSNWMETW